MEAAVWFDYLVGRAVTPLAAAARSPRPSVTALRRELVRLAAERRASVATARLDGAARQPDSAVALHVVSVNHEAECGGEEEGAGRSKAERQSDERGERGNEGRNRERVHGKG